MCGIAGFFKTDLGRPDLETLTRSIAHRGPDGQGVYHNPELQIGLGHRRLAIIDTSPNAAQPLFHESGVVTVFNGEIYNYLELKKNHPDFHFKTHSDTEVALHEFVKYGKDCFYHWNGMWAVAFFDPKSQKLTLSVDRFGKKPLYYMPLQGGIIFASELKSFLKLSDKLHLRWDMASVKTSLYSINGTEASGRTLFQNIYSLLPGHCLEVEKDGKISISQWWDTAKNLKSNSAKGDAVLIEEFRELFLDSCRLRLRSDVPIGTSLSGGLDSSTVAVCISNILTKNQEYFAFSHLFPGTKLDEKEFIDEVLNVTSLKPVWVTAGNNLAEEIDATLLHFESIYPGIPDSADRVYQAQRAQGVFVTLDGHGADELFGGYHNYAFKALVDSIPHPQKMFSSYQHLKNQMGFDFSFQTFLTGLGRNLFTLSDTNAILIALKKYSNSMFEAAKPLLIKEGFHRAELAKPPEQLDLINQALYIDFHQRILPRVLRNFDLASMRHGVEVRMPFLDYRVVDFAFSIPSSLKLKDGYSKKIIRDAFPELPEKIRYRKLKLGFNSPFQDWLAGPLKPWIIETLSQKSSFDDWIDRKILLKFYETNILTQRAKWSDAGWFWAWTSAVRLSQLLESQVSLS